MASLKQRQLAGARLLQILGPSPIEPYARRAQIESSLPRFAIHRNLSEPAERFKRNYTLTTRSRLSTQALTVIWDTTCPGKLSCIYKRLLTFTIDTEIRTLLILQQGLDLYCCTRSSCLCTSLDFRHPLIRPGLMLLPLSRLAETRSCQPHDKRVRKLLQRIALASVFRGR